jgi:uncharacterized membrane protein YGL010W
MMTSQNYTDTPGYLFILAGALLAAVSSFVPYFDAGFHLMTSVLIAGLIPYIVYSVAVVLMRGALTTLAGAAMVAVHAWLVVSERFAREVDYSDGMIYYVPILMAIVVLPLAIAALRQPWENRIVHAEKAPEAEAPAK